MTGQGQEPALKTAMDHIQPGKGLFFALWDPVGITQELNFEQKVAHDAALVPFAHGLWAASAIDRLKDSAFLLSLLIIAALFGVVMNYFKDRAMYDWLERCFFGIKSEDERFPSLREDSKAFEVALS